MSHNKIQLYTSRLMALLLCLSLVFACAPSVSANDRSGSCGSNLSWTLSAGTLTITGSGDMTEFNGSSWAPWYPYRHEILRLELPAGLTSIGKLAFYECRNLTAVVIPNSVTKIGDYAFAWCENLRILTIGSGVRSIGEAAFSDCYKIASLELPAGLNSIGTKGFYRCESITTVTVPGSVTSMGVSVFAYCKNLVTANINASIKTVPEYTFYGCERLTTVKLPDTTQNVSSYSFRGCDQLDTVYYAGTNLDVSEIHTSIGEGLPEFSSSGTVTGTVPSTTPVTSGTVWQDENGNYNEDQVTVTTGQNSSVSSKVEDTYQPDGTKVDSSAEINVNINNQQGWNEVQDTVKQELDKVTEKTENVTVNVYVKETDEIDSGFMDTMAEKNVTVTVTTENGSSWVVDGSQWNAGTLSGTYNLTHTVSAASESLAAELGAVNCFSLTFSNSAEVNSEVLIHLGSAWAMQEATLLQRGKNGFTKVQTTVVDRDGYAHFYLASVNADTEYAIAMNLPRQTDDPAPIVPAVMQTGDSNVVNYNPVQYQITGRSSSWGMGLGQVMGILAVVMVSVVIVVGGVMFAWNKRRLRNGYVPDWDDDDE